MDKKVKEGWHLLYELMRHTKGQAQFSQLMELLLTPDEYQDLAMRMQIVKALLDGKLTQRQIAQDVGVSIAKITRGSNGLKRISPALKNYLDEVLGH